MIETKTTLSTAKALAASQATLAASQATLSRAKALAANKVALAKAAAVENVLNNPAVQEQLVKIEATLNETAMEALKQSLPEIIASATAVTKDSMSGLGDLVLGGIDAVPGLNELGAAGEEVTAGFQLWEAITRTGSGVLKTAAHITNVIGSEQNAINTNVNGLASAINSALPQTPNLQSAQVPMKSSLGGAKRRRTIKKKRQRKPRRTRQRRRSQSTRARRRSRGRA